MPNRYLPIPMGTDEAQKWAVVNKNFAELDNQAATKTFLIASEGSTTVPALNLNTGGAQYGTSQGSVTITHGLGYAPVVIAATEGGMTIPTVVYSTSSTTGYIHHNYTITSTSTSVIFFVTAFGYNGDYTSPALNIKYYLLQKVAD